MRDFDPSAARRAVTLFASPRFLAVVTAPTAPSMQYSSSLAGLTPELVELLLNHMSRERLLRPRSLELFFGCPLQKFVLNCYPYCTNELLRQLRAFPALRHLSLVNSPLITGKAAVKDVPGLAVSALFTHCVCTGSVQTLACRFCPVCSNSSTSTWPHVANSQTPACSISQV